MLEIDEEENPHLSRPFYTLQRFHFTDCNFLANPPHYASRLKVLDSFDDPRPDERDSHTSFSSTLRRKAA